MLENSFCILRIIVLELVGNLLWLSEDGCSVDNFRNCVPST